MNRNSRMQKIKKSRRMNRNSDLFLDYGVKGMKWGHRKQQPVSGSSGNVAAAKPTPSKPAAPKKPKQKKGFLESAYDSFRDFQAKCKLMTMPSTWFMSKEKKQRYIENNRSVGGRIKNSMLGPHLV